MSWAGRTYGSPVWRSVLSMGYVSSFTWLRITADEGMSTFTGPHV